MNPFRLFSLAAMLFSSLLLILPAQASIVTYNFSADISSGPLVGNLYTGYFSYDSSIVTPGGPLSATGLFTDLNLGFGSQTYTEANANTGYLRWDNAGTLIGVIFGNSCSPGSCFVGAGNDQMALRYFAENANFQDVIYSQVGAATVYFSAIGSSISERENDVPEPASLALLLADIGALALSRGRQSDM